MKRLFNVVPFPAVFIGLIAGLAAVTLGRPHVYWVTSGYSQASFLLTFASAPSEAMLVDATIQKDSVPGATKHSETCDVAMYMGNQRFLRICPWSAGVDPDVVLPDGSRMKAVWLTEPATRIHFPTALVRISYFLGASISGVLAVFLLRWAWYFSLARLRELSRAIRGG